MYVDREDAGRRLAEALGHYRGRDDLLVLGLPRGGVVVAAEVARALNAPLDVLIVRKLGAPMNPEYGFGAIASGGVQYLDEGSVRALGLLPGEVETIAAREREELTRRSRTYRGERPELQVTGKAVILVDDGLATGNTARAAIRALRQGNPAAVVLAVPVAPPDAVADLGREVDELVCPWTPPGFRAIGLFYDVFDQTSDEEVMELLQWRPREGTP